ncbi:hypothetical protein [Streptomyces sp. NPDC054784]
MHPYEPSSPVRNHLVHSRFPGTCGPDAAASGGSNTPIYDALYAEYGRLFRALPGDRSGEEEFRFERFGTVHGTGTGLWGGTPRYARGGALPAALPPAPRDGHRYGL